MKVVLVSAVALIDPDGRVLLAQRPEGKSMAGLWEFPGGKVEAGETPEAALIREKLELMQKALGSRHAPSGPLAGPDFEGTIWDFVRWLARKDRALA